MDVADFFGIATGNKMTDKFERTGYTARKSTYVGAPIVEEFPVVMECEFAEVVETESMYCRQECQYCWGRKCVVLGADAIVYVQYATSARYGRM